MALLPMDTTQVNRGINVCKNLIENIKPVLDELDTYWNTAAIGGNARLIQADLDSNTAWSGMTKQQLADGMFALTSTLKGNLATALTQLAQLATRAQ